ncbi:MAG: A/G-specific adenine glycosylase [Bacteroidota bacterium]
MNQIVFEIFQWFSKNGRNLPWRNTKDPYKIWLSEIILQQTQIIQGQAYYEKFVENFPTVNALANASEEKVLKLWQGLGYYSRARNLHKAARIIKTTYKGKFPDNYVDILQLPGIGEYTAAAISSFAYHMPYPALDGNVYRFISRLYNIDAAIDEPKNKKIYMAVLTELIHNQDPAIFNNAMMEMGALVCKPALPDCKNCCVANYCEALKSGTIAKLPVKNKKLTIKNRYFNYLFIDYKNGFYIEKRTGKDIWENLYQLPLIESLKPLDISEIAEAISKELSIQSTLPITLDKEVKHVLTHQKLHTRFWILKPEKQPQFKNNDIIFTDRLKYKKLALPQLIANYLLHL